MSTFTKSINVTARCAVQFLSDKLEGTGISGCQCPYIMNTVRNPGISQEALSELISINKSNVARQLLILEKDGFVERVQSNTDRRVTLVYPTQKAKDISGRIAQVHSQWHEYLTQGFSDEQREELSAMLEKVMKRADEYVKSQGKGRV